MSERGSVTVLVVGLVGMLVVLGMMLGAAGQFLSARGRVQAAADAAALAAAPVTFRRFGSSGDPAAEAARLAGANGARLIRCFCSIDRSWDSRIVEVEVGEDINVIGLGLMEVRGKAAAEFIPVQLLALDDLD